MENKIELYTTYAPDTDITFIMRDTYDDHGDIKKTEVVGWYHGEPDEELTLQYVGKLTAEY